MVEGSDRPEESESFERSADELKERVFDDYGLKGLEELDGEARRDTPGEEVEEGEKESNAGVSEKIEATEKESDHVQEVPRNPQ